MMKKCIHLMLWLFFSYFFCAAPFAAAASGAAQKPLTQQQLSDFAKNTNFKFGVISNFDDAGDKTNVRMTLSNKSDVSLPAGESTWRIYFHGMRKFSVSEKAPIRINRVIGDLTEIVPTKAFPGLEKGAVLEIITDASHWVVTQNDFMPRAFITADGLTPALFANTDTETFENFVEPFVTPQQQQRFGKETKDLYVVATAQSRYKDNGSVAQTKIPAQEVASRIIPKPVSTKIKSGVTLLDASWEIRYAGLLASEATYFQNELDAAGIALKSAPDTESVSGKAIVLLSDASIESEGYELVIDEKKIVIKGGDNAGVFYGLQSLLNLMTAPRASQYELPRLTITDSPRYKWRGMHYDMARNFHGKAATLRLIDQMSHYKLNKLHMHLTEDEGWRIEIPGLPELTEIGANRCFDLTEQKCLITQLGTGPFKTGNGNGFYTADDFIEILKYAAVRHVDVIPEVDMPGHARAAIKSMQARYKRLLAEGKKSEAEQYLLSDPNDQSQYMSVQSYKDNAINVCLPSTYVFVDKVVYEIQQMYRKAGLNLATFHMGGDEVGKGAWQKSPVCQALFASGQAGLVGVTDLKPYFVEKVSKITSNRGMALAGWEDGLMYDPLTVFNRKQFANEQVVGMAWDNIWEAGLADRAYRLANNGYKVVLVPSSHLYFDHPYEANPEERGAYWATRYSDTRKVFEFMPDNYYANADKTAEGKPITNLEALVGRKMIPLTKPDNILGMQGAVWTEAIRTPEQLEQMIYPRIMALAERAWHKATWEADRAALTERVKAEREHDWAVFTNVLTQRVLPKLALSGSAFYIPPPGGVVNDGLLFANSAQQGLEIEYSIDGGSTWRPYSEQVKVPANSKVSLRSKQGNVYSRATNL